MKQIVTAFRAEGAQARRLLQLCRKTSRARLADLRDDWKKVVRETSALSAYVEYMDSWSMGDDFKRIMGPDAERRSMPNGEVFFLLVNQAARLHFRRQLRRKHQFAEQKTLAQLMATLANASGVAAPIALAVFREVVGGSVSNEEGCAGMNQPLSRTVRKPATR